MTENAESLPRTLKEVESDLHASVRRAKRDILLLAILNVLVLGLFTNLYIQAGKLDAEQLTRFARIKIEEGLPGLGDQVRDAAIESAPEVLDQGRQLMLDAMSLGRKELEDLILDQARATLREAEHRLDEHLLDATNEQLEIMEAAHPDATPEEQLDLLFEELRGNYVANMTALIDHMYEDYRREIDRVDGYLLRLQTGEHLNETRKLDRQIVQVWVVLIEDHSILPELPRELPDGMSED